MTQTITRQQENILTKRADAIAQAAADNPGVGFPLDFELAQFMGAFNEDALEIDEIFES